mmetsp:Transcript_2312/g.4954  ORF Transcript_2312/g.4954 Transcript_2312/m.4954 type:complete len:218 (-) Transcript_2312:131-784(-)|eukprot:CAMPEP_0171958200 /NCGR_PEP_ID=MMETSP0993-20121228/137972_1 /TAXON_ID=483369 /ORGANISM="non described non described, Strain CCMP2098" /LENGTH=217 /DNA_ID=CAMNT_0012605345 /DNA_START=46 /DNA_END=699 /DNA_ORIENTATION=+
MDSASKKRRRPVEVVVCGDPWKNDFPKPLKHESNKQTKEPKPKMKHEEGGEFDMQTSFRSVVDLGSTQFEGWQRKQYEQSKVEDLGGRQAKSQKMPLKMLVGIRAKRVKIAELREGDARAAGIVVAKNSRVHGQAKGKRDDDGPGIDRNVRGGVMHVSKDLLTKMNVPAMGTKRGGGKGKGKGSGKGKGGGKGSRGKGGGKGKGKGGGKGKGKGKGR